MHSEVPFNTEVTKGDCGDVPFHAGGGVGPFHHFWVKSANY